MKEEQVKKVIGDEAGVNATETGAATGNSEGYKPRYVEGKLILPDLKPVRESYVVKKGNTQYLYRVSGIKHGREVFADFCAGSFSVGSGNDRRSYKDKEIYDLLDDMFTYDKDISLGVSVEKNTFNGGDDVRLFFVGYSAEENVYDIVPVTLCGPSDKSILADLIRRLRSKYNYSDFPNVL